LAGSGAKNKTALRASKSDRMDIHAVAKLAHVSIAIRFPAPSITFPPSIRRWPKRVWEAIRELDYFPNTQARALVSGRSRLLGLIVSEITNPFFPELIQGFEEVAVEKRIRGPDRLDELRSGKDEELHPPHGRAERRGSGRYDLRIEQPLLDQLRRAARYRWCFVDVAPNRPA